MAIPDFQALMLPVLRASANGEVKISEVVGLLRGRRQTWRSRRGCRRHRRLCPPTAYARLLPRGGPLPSALARSQRNAFLRNVAQQMGV